MRKSILSSLDAVNVRWVRPSVCVVTMMNVLCLGPVPPPSLDECSRSLAGPVFA